MTIDTELITAIITCILTAISSLFLNNLSNPFRNKKVQEMMSNQLNAIYEPFAKQIELNENYFTSETYLKDIKDNLSNNFSLYPSKLKSICIALINSTTNKDELINEFELLIISNYNWLRKQLKYPYEEKKIYESFLEDGFVDAKYKLQFYLSLIFLTFTGIIGLYDGYYLMKDLNELSIGNVLIGLLAIAVIALGLFMLFLVSFNFKNRKKLLRN